MLQWWEQPQWDVRQAMRFPTEPRPRRRVFCRCGEKLHVLTGRSKALSMSPRPDWKCEVCLAKS